MSRVMDPEALLPPSAPATSRTGSDPSIRAQLCPKQRERLPGAADQREVSTPPCSGLGPALHCPGTPSQKGNQEGNPSWKTNEAMMWLMTLLWHKKHRLFLSPLPHPPTKWVHSS